MPERELKPPTLRHILAAAGVHNAIQHLHQMVRAANQCGVTAIIDGDGDARYLWQGDGGVSIGDMIACFRKELPCGEVLVV